MEPPPGIVFAQEIEWTCKEPALVVWTDPSRSDLSSLGLPCPTGNPTLLTLWIGQDGTKSTHVMLHLRISVRISKRRKTLDHFLLPSSDFCATEGCSSVNLEDASENVRQCLEEAYGKSSTKKCLRVPFHQPKQGRVLMPVIPEGAPCLGGTALHLLTLFRSLSLAQKFDIYVGHSSYAQHALMKIESGISVCGLEVNLLRAYKHGGVFDDWRQIGDERSIDRPGPQEHVAQENVASGQPICSPPPYSPPLQTTEFPTTPENIRATMPLIKETPCLKRSRVSSSLESSRPLMKLARSASPSQSLSNVTKAHYSPQRSHSLESTVYSPTILNTPSTVTPNIKPTIFTTKHKPTIFTTKHEPPDYTQKDAFQSIKGQINSSTSNPCPTAQSHIDDLVSTIAYHQNLAEISLQETLDDHKIELQLEREKAIEEIEDYGQEVLENVKSQMEDLAGGYLVGFEDMLQRRGKEVEEMREGGLGVDGEGVVRERGGYDDWVDLLRRNSRRRVVSGPLQMTDVRETPLSVTSPSSLTDTPATAATAATKIFLCDFKHLCLTDKVKVLERLASRNTAEIFLTVDTELREAWVASWIV